MREWREGRNEGGRKGGRKDRERSRGEVCIGVLDWRHF